MGLESLKDTIKKQIYIIYGEKYTNNSNHTFIERFVGKHPLLRPEFIVVNDQIHGFKKMSKKVSTLEEFPIYLEIEGIIDEDKTQFIDSIELYTESYLNCQERLTDIIYLTKRFQKYIDFERIIDVQNPKEQSIVITSKIQDFLINITEERLKEAAYNFDDNDEDDDDNLDNFAELSIEMSEFNQLLSQQLKYFVEFIRCCDDLIIKKKSLEHIEKSIEKLFTEDKK